jgi:hypothetical protein
VWDAIRVILGGKLTQKQVDGINAIYVAWLEQEVLPSDVSKARLAYVLATVHWETNKTFEPVREAYYMGEPRAETYRKTLRYYPWYGRGLVQLTWKDNYVRADNELGLGGTLVANPDRALELGVSVKVLVIGMIEGWFTGKKLSDYIKPNSVDFIGARRIINGTDMNKHIASVATRYLEALKAPL